MPEKGTKTVGRRVVPERVSFDEALAWQSASSMLFGPRPLCQRGVFRFRSFQEAHEWMIDQASRRSPAVPQPLT